MDSDEKPVVRKVRFQPKPPPRRPPPRAAAVKKEVNDDAEAAEKKELLRRLQDSAAGKPKTENKLGPQRVAFGHGSSVPAHHYNASYASNARYQDDVSISKDKKEYQEPWNYCELYPSSYPLRRPYSGNPDILNEEEFGQASTFDETMINSAKELGLAENTEPRMLFFQLPKTLPAIKRDVTATPSGQASTSSLKPPSGVNLAEKGCRLNELQAGKIGKLMVYKSGRVKLKLGDTLYDVSPGSDCGFAQDVNVMDAGGKHCCAVGELQGRAVVTPDVDSILDQFADLG